MTVFNKCEKCGRERVSVPCPENLLGCCVQHFAECECEKEFNLSKKIFWKYKDPSIPCDYLSIKYVKEFIKRRDEIINDFLEGKITSIEMRQKLDKLAGQKLSGGAEE